MVFANHLFPRFDFLLCAMNQLVNHADKIEIITMKQYNQE